jgi:Acyltransferase
LNSKETGQPHQTKRPFKPAKPTAWLIKAAQEFVRADLSLSNKVQIVEAELDVLRNLPKGAGAIITSNHADETDPRVCIELSRRSGKRFISMCNREAFDEAFGLAGWTLQRLGHFSVERGAHDVQAKDFAVSVIKQAQDVLVIFPEGEIFYLNESVQPFHSGAIEIGMQAILHHRKTDPNWTTYIVPMAIKYHHTEPIDGILEKRIAKMEARLSVKSTQGSLPQRLRALQQLLIEREEIVHHINFDARRVQNLTQEIITAQDAILSEVEERLHKPLADQRQAIDKSWQLSAEIKDNLNQKIDSKHKAELLEDIASLEEVAQLSSWQPRYYSDAGASLDRMAEAVLKLERELYKIKRPRQLANRDVFIKLADPIDLGLYVADYLKDPHSVRHSVTHQLQATIQSLIDELASVPFGK